MGVHTTLQSRSYLFLLIVLLLGTSAGIVFAKYKFNLGLDVVGGVRITYQIDDSKLTAAQRQTGKVTYKENILRTLNSRAHNALGVTEPNVFPKGDDQFVVELPNLKDSDEAKRVLGTSVSIKFYDARTVQTKTKPFLNYRTANSEAKLDKSDHSVVTFDYLGKEIKPGDPEYQAMIDSWGEPIIQGDELSHAEPQVAGNGKYIPSMTFSPSAAPKMSEWSRRYRDTGENLAAVLDNEVISIAPLKEGAILSDGAVIDGTFTPEYVGKLCNLLNSGALPVDLVAISSEKVDPTIGQHALDQIVRAGMIAFGIISIFLIGYYALPGFIAFIALLLYMLFTLAVMKFIGATFSLASIAGFILSVGMAVDANILVFERFREEMKSGKSLVAAMDLGFRRALPAIIDSNTCTIITSLVLAILGTGPVRGFATTLIIGVGISLFTAVSVSRSLLFFLVQSGIADNVKWYAVDREWFHKLFATSTEPLRVVEKATKWFVISGITILIGVPFAFMGGFKLNVEFRGGTELQYSLKDDAVTPAQVAKNLEDKGFRGPNVKLGTDAAGGKLIYITVEDTPELKGKSDAETQAYVAQAGGINAEYKSISKVGGAIQAETVRNAALGVLYSAGLIIIFLGFRFGFSVGGFVPGLRFAISAIGALVHDILVVFFLAALVGYFLHWEISALFITAMLTIIGFSVHDTIVIFDRIRENLRKSQAGVDFGDLMDRSITQSFARSINTSMTVIVTLLILVGFGTATIDLKFFCVAMLVGIVSGTYSSIYNASPILYLWDKAIAAQKGPQASLVGLAHAEHARSRIVAPQAVVPTSATTSVPNTPAAPGGQAGGRTYGQVKRRANQLQNSQRNIDEEP